MKEDTHLIDRIYEASVMPERWPDILQDIADRAGARGTTIVSRSPAGFDLIVSPKMLDDANDFIAQGWGADIEFTGPLFAEQWPGFRAETAYRTPEEIAAMPVHAEFLDPRGYLAGAATVIQGAGDNALHMALEGFPSHVAAQQAIDFLDTLRPHLARSVSLATLRPDRSRVVVDSLALASVAAAVISSGGRLRAVNAPFLARMENRMVESQTGLRFTDRLLMSQVTLALERHRVSQGRVQSVAVRGEEDTPPFAIHLLPILGAAREACGSDGVLLLIADVANASIPDADLLRLLFDLTPAEARLARQLLEGQTIDAAARHNQIGIQTARTHLARIFSKTGVRRQADLIRLLAGLGPPRLGSPRTDRDHPFE